MNVLNLEVLASRLHAEQKPAVHSSLGYSAVSTAYATSDHDGVALGYHIDYFHFPVWKRPKDIFEISGKSLPALDDALFAIGP